MTLKEAMPPILAALFVLFPIIGAVAGFVGRRRPSFWLCVGCYSLWFCGLLGVGIMVGLG